MKIGILDKILNRISELQVCRSWRRIREKRHLLQQGAKEPENIPAIRCRKYLFGKGDGEWCVCPTGLGPQSVVYSFGVGTDIRFDLELIKQFGMTVHAFDPTPISKDWLSRQNIPGQFLFHPIGLASHDGQATFSLPDIHTVSFTLAGKYQGPTSRECVAEVATLSTIMQSLGHARIDVLKIDIEGAEYDVIPEIIRISDRIGQLLIEFHHRFRMDQEGFEATRSAIQQLEEAGFKLFDVSPRGLEYGFLNTRFLQ